MTTFLMLITVALVVGYIGHYLIKDNIPGGLAGSFVTGFAGAWLGYYILGKWGPTLFDFPIAASFIGAILFTLILSVLSKLTLSA
ncbi:membrane protein [Paenibacillus sp. J31TS4]|uniref:GlsB/YeaQ/YmgE family stress response membrane protein n=1 Tax=Paenibacillus sp. J31TS4 TaxID=2807195 RepID=UPI001B23925B|nr:GlsB/YeaQ/YmgE family stress response membrane protein [Paenibacillus sp. J31TS4]GIP40038.1 membrane protein [Paenibacillus sp. J31TS4]